MSGFNMLLVVIAVALFFGNPVLAAEKNNYATAADMELMEGFPPQADKQVTKSVAEYLQES